MKVIKKTLLKSLSKSVLTFLHKLSGVDGEYVSHCSALAFFSISSADLKSITIVSPRRRRNRTLDGIKLKFIFSSKICLGDIEHINIGQYFIPISNIYQTIIDLLTNTDFAPDIKELGYVFSTATFNIDKLLELAMSVSEASAKRCLFWLLWTGQLDYNDIPFANLTRTPVILDNRYKELEHKWEGRIFTHFPKFLLGIAPRLNNKCQMPNEYEGWQELKCYERFLQYCLKREWFPILNDTRPRNNKLLECFYREEINQLSKLSHRRIILTLFDNTNSLATSAPALLREWLLNQNICDFFPWLPEWVEAKLKKNKKNTNDLQNAIILGIRLGKNKEVAESFTRNLDLFIKDEQYQLVSFVCRYFLAKSVCPYPSIYFAASWLNRVEGNFKEALNILTRAIEYFKNKKISDHYLKNLHFHRGGVLMRLGQFAEADEEFYHSIKFSTNESKHFDSGTMNLMRGNSYYLQKKMDKAKTLYLKALENFIGADDLKCQGLVLHNIGIIELEEFRYLEAYKYFSRAYAQSKKIKSNYINLIVMAASKGRSLLRMGCALSSTKIFEKALEMQEEFKVRVDKTIEEIYSYLVIAFIFSGHEAKAKNLQNKLDLLIAKLSVSKIIVLSSLSSIMIELVSHNLEKAYSKIECLLSKASELEINCEDYVWLMFRKAQIEHQLCNNSSLETFAQCQKSIQSIKHGNVIRLMKLYAVAHKIPILKERNLEKDILWLLNSRAFDPLWITYAEGLLLYGGETVTDYLKAQFNKTSVRYLAKQEKRNSHLADLFNKLRKGIGNIKSAYLIKQGNIKVINDLELILWRNNRRKETIYLDCIEGTFYGFDKKFSSRANIYSVQLLAYLLVSFPDPVDVVTAFKSIWGTAYDKDIDECPLKGAIQRLRRNLKIIAPSSKVLWSKKSGGWLKLEMNCKWEAVI